MTDTQKEYIKQRLVNCHKRLDLGYTSLITEQYQQAIRELSNAATGIQQTINDIFTEEQKTK